MFSSRVCCIEVSSGLRLLNGFQLHSNLRGGKWGVEVRKVGLVWFGFIVYQPLLDI